MCVERAVLQYRYSIGWTNNRTMDLSNSSGEAAEEEKELEDKKMKDSRKVKRICSKKSKIIDPSFPQEILISRSFISS